MEDLLYLTLPFPVARYEVYWQGCAIVSMLNISRDIQLKKRVSAEKIGPVTIYHSDIVNFTDLFSDSTPFEVSHRTTHLDNLSLLYYTVQMVLMLNNYYKMFDDSMSKYQVYKVNCVNDSHMIVAGMTSI